MNPADPSSKVTELLGYFSDYRSEWEHQQFSSFFVEPSYYTTLLKRRPSLLIGGRGTGKTTALKALRFDALEGRRPTAGGSAPPYFGIYLRINKNRVTAFHGNELPEADWTKAFSHYFNLLACKELCQLAEWLHSQAPSGTSLEVQQVTQSLGLPPLSEGSVANLNRALDTAVDKLELFVNNPRSMAPPIFSMADAPLKRFAAALRDAGLLGDATIFCCVDEYENLTEEQQSVVNTYLKHSEPPLTYKIGLRRNGLKTRGTIDENDLIATPDDYDEVDISSEGFEEFACEVASVRLGRALDSGICVPAAPDEFLPELSSDIEADRLGAKIKADTVRDELDKEVDLVDWLQARTDRELAFLRFWQARDNSDTRSLARQWMCDPSEWQTRLGNYGYTALVWLSVGRKGARIRKYYSGLRTFLSLASGNIRYFLELIDTSIVVAQARGELCPRPADGLIVVSPEAQTEAARKVGQRRLSQIEELGRCGAELRRYVLAIGKVFFEFARDPGKSPETNCFVLSGESTAREAVETILNEGVANQVFEVTAKTKATSPHEMRDDEYRIHPIYCPFFEFSHRRKRRVTFKAEALLMIRDNPRRAISLLSGTTISKAEQPETQERAGELPEQLAMFADFFDGGSHEN